MGEGGKGGMGVCGGRRIDPAKKGNECSDCRRLIFWAA